MRLERMKKTANSMSMAIQIAAQAVETEVRFSLGQGRFPVVLDSQVLEEQETKYLTMKNAVEILSAVTESLVQLTRPNANAMEIASEVDAILCTLTTSLIWVTSYISALVNEHSYVCAR